MANYSHLAFIIALIGVMIGSASWTVSDVMRDNVKWASRYAMMFALSLGLLILVA